MYFPFIVIIIKYFYAEKVNSHFYNKEVNPHFFKFIFPLPLILSESCFLKNFKYSFPFNLSKIIHIRINRCQQCTINLVADNCGIT